MNRKKMIVLFAILLVPFFVQAANLGNCTGHAWGEEAGYISFGGAASDTDYGVTVSAVKLTGYAWGEETGWISMDCANTSTCGTVNYGVLNDGIGNLSGYAWTELAGWINFKDSGGGNNYAVTIDSGGNFQGYAWNEAVGYINMNDTGANYGVNTSWRAIVAPTVITNSVSSITSTTAQGNGNITATGGQNPTRSIEWGTSTGVYTTGSCSAGTGTTGLYDCPIINLSPNTTYFVRAKANNDGGTSYGSETSFKTTPATPADLSASDGTYTDKVALSWTASAGATGYKLSTDDGSNWSDIGNVTTYDDTNAPVPTINQNATTATDGTSSTQVTLSSTASVSAGTAVTYKVIAYNATGDGPATSGEAGNRGAGTLSYQWQKSSGDTNSDYSDINDATNSAYDDTAAPAGTITAGTASATDGTGTDVTLSSSGESTSNGAGRYYKVILNSPDATQVTSSPNRGYRSVGTLSYQWQVSSADSNENYGDINGGTADPYDYPSAPVNGNGRYFRCVYSAEGSSQATSAPDRGYRITLSVTTGDASDLTPDSATLSGNVTDTGGYNPTDRYIQYGTNESYGSSCSAGSGESGTFSCGATTLNNNVEYHFRACATNSETTVCGDDATFSTTIAEPQVTTDNISDKNATSARGHGTITDTGGENPTRYIQWGTESGNYTDSCNVGIGTGSYSCNLINLSPDTTYYYRAKAENSAGPTNGSEKSFKTLVGSVIISNPNSDDIDDAIDSGYFTIIGTVSDASQVETNTNVTLTDINGFLTIPEATIITNTDEEENFNFSEFIIEDALNQVKSTVSESWGALKIGIPTIGITFSQPITLSINVGTQYNGKEIEVQYQDEGETDWTHATYCTVTEGFCTFTTSHATTFTANGDGTFSSADPVDINLAINAGIAINCDPDVTLGPIVQDGKSDLSTNSATCTIRTNNSDGYSLTLKADDPNLTSASDTLNPITASSTPTTWDGTAVPDTASGWGYRLSSTSDTPNSKWGTDDQSNVNYGTTAKWYKATASDYQLTTRSEETDNDGDSEILNFGAEIGAGMIQPTGTYTTTVTLTAVTL